MVPYKWSRHDSGITLHSLVSVLNFCDPDLDRSFQAWIRSNERAQDYYESCAGVPFETSATNSMKELIACVWIRRRFLNRLLGVEVGHQNLLFSYFLATLAAEVKAAKEEGRYSEGVSDLPVSDIREPPPPQVLLSYDDYMASLQILAFAH